MSTEYTLSLFPGYLSGYSYKGDCEEAWQELLKAVEILRYQPERIVAEVYRVEPNAPPTCEKGCCTLYDAATWYNPDIVNPAVGPLVFKPEEYTIVQLTTSGGNNREVKEPVRRAFCRLIIEEMHRLGIEVCLQVS